MNMNTFLRTLLTIVFGLVCGFCVQNHKRINKIESYLTHSHGYDASKELGFYNPFDERERN